MKNRQQVHHLFILDESGSMLLIQNYIKKGFKNLFDELVLLNKDMETQDHYYSLLSFNSNKLSFLNYFETLSDLNKIDLDFYCPNGLTPLYDAIGFSISKIDAELSLNQISNVNVTIISDGEENASNEYCKEKVEKIIKEVKKKGWDINYFGTNHSLENAIDMLGNDKTFSFSSDADGLDLIFDLQLENAIKYSLKIKSNYIQTDLIRS